MLRRLRIPLAFSPALVTAWLVAQNAVNVPVWDDWERTPLLAAWHAGTLGLADLYAPHIDHRIVFPRLSMLANFALTGGDLRVEMGFTFAVALAGAAALAALLRRTLAARAAPAIFFANLLLFSPLQWENFLWAIQTAFVLPLSCLAGALLALASPLSNRARFAACLALAVVATHSFGHGLLLWPAVAAYVWLEPGDRPRRGFLAAWLLAAALVLVPYFGVGGLENQSLHAYGVERGDAPGLGATRGALADPRVAAAFWLKMLGSPLARTPWWPSHALAPKLGLALLALFAAAWLAARRSADIARALPWLVLGAASIAGCALAGLGRAGLEVHPNYALVPRYAAIGTQLLVALVALAALLLPRRVAVAAGVALALPLAWAWNVGVQGMAAWREARLHARTSLVYIQHFPPRYVGRLDWDADSARSWAVQADRIGLLDPPLAPEPTLAPFAADAAAGTPAPVTNLHARVRDGVLRVRGRAASHGVLVTYREGDSVPRVLGLGELRTPAPRRYERQDHIFNLLELEGVESGRWSVEIPLAALPTGARVELEIFAVDAAALRAARLAERVVVLQKGDRVDARVESD